MPTPTPRAAFLAGALGCALLVAVVAARLCASGERADVALLCDGEARSGLAVRSDLAGVSRWIRAHLRTVPVERAFAAVRDSPLDERSGRLRALARGAGLRGCPLADTFDALANEAAYRGELQTLCSYVTFPGLAELDDAARVEALEAWIRESASTPRMRALAAPLAEAPPRQRAALLKAVAREVDVWTCDVAKVFDAAAMPLCGN
jgi:hypothetical protein